MTDDIPQDPPPLTPQQEDEVQAAELALGLLEGDEARAAHARMAAEPGFARAVRDWHERLALLAEGLTPVMAPARARQGIRERLGHIAAPLTEDPAAPLPWWRGPWSVIAGVLAAAMLAALLVLPGGDQAPVPGVPGYHAELVFADADLRVGATLAGREMEVALESGTAAPGRDYEIWWIAADGSAPVSIGLVPHDGALRMTLPEGLDPAEGVQIALSDEPQGGSPTGQATGPVVAIAALTPT